jgi:hypothetical protein
MQEIHENAMPWADRPGTRSVCSCDLGFTA